MGSGRSSTWPLQYVAGNGETEAEELVPIAKHGAHHANGPHRADAPSSETTTSRFGTLAQTLGLEAFYLLYEEWRGRTSIEKKKTVIIGDVWSACYVSVLHVIPMLASINLIVLNWKGVYIGKELQGPVGEDGLKFLGLQFAAKILELLAVASLSTIIFALIRDQLISDELPFGAVTAGFDFSKLSLLWSKGFAATCTARCSSSRKKFLLIMTIIIFTILGATIGPAAAVAAQPNLQDWSAGGTVMWLNTTSDQLWPTQLDEVGESDLACSSSQNNSCVPTNHELLANEILASWPSTSPDTDIDPLSKVVPEHALIAGRGSMRNLVARYRGPFSYQPDLTAVTVPSAAIADAVSQVERYWFIANARQCAAGKARFCWYRDITWSLKALQPVTYVRCSASDVNTTPQFPRLDQGPGVFPLVSYEHPNLGSRDWFETFTQNGSNANLTWVGLPEAQFGLTSLGAVVALPGSNSSNTQDQVIACTVDARWANATAKVTFLNGPLIVLGEPKDWFLGAQRKNGDNGLPKWARVKVSTEWANSINPTMISGSSLSVFAMLCNSVGRLNNISAAPKPINAVETILALMVTDGLAQTTGTATIQGSLKGFDNGEWMHELLPKKSMYGSAGSAFNYIPKNGDRTIKLEVKTAVNGYGYGITTATILSTLVLLIYAIIALVYAMHSIFLAKSTSSAWESVTDLIALAASSHQSPALRNTGAGIDTLGTLKQPVRVGVSDGRLQMVFGRGEHITKIRKSHQYG